jgi:hypothetical protein
MSTRLISRVSTLDAARVVFFIVVGFAIKQSLGLFGHTWPPRDFPYALYWPIWARVLIGAGYLVTVIRFSHGVVLLHTHEMKRLQTSSLPSASKISELSLFLVLLGVLLFLMADNITELRAYALWSALMFAVDFLYIWRSHMVRKPMRRLFKVLEETVSGYGARAAVWWMATDAVLFLVCCSFLIRSPVGGTLAQLPAGNESLLALILIAEAIADYWLNWEYYFGGKEDRRKEKFVFVCSPLRNDDPKLYQENINRAQFYCWRLMKENAAAGKKITPFASHAFFTYFLNDNVAEDRALGRECALAYLSACEAIYVFVPGQMKDFHPKIHSRSLSEGMKHEISQAKKYGLEIEYLPEDQSLAGWNPPPWTAITYESRVAKANPSDSFFKGAEERKKVYVCTGFRGKGFDQLPSWECKVRRLKDNTKLALWHCHQLARHDGEALAPFAPQAFFPYFWKFSEAGKMQDDLWEAWFERSIEVLKVCNAVYIYTKDGLPPTEDQSSTGVMRVDETAKRLGLEIQYRRELPLPSEEEKKKAEGRAEVAVRLVERVLKRKLEANERAFAFDEAAAAMERTLPKASPEVVEIKKRAKEAREQAERFSLMAESAELRAQKKKEEVQKTIWNPAVPDFG